jgi:hypothetical protein
MGVISDKRRDNGAACEDAIELRARSSEVEETGRAMGRVRSDGCVPQMGAACGDSLDERRWDWQVQGRGNTAQLERRSYASWYLTRMGPDIHIQRVDGRKGGAYD